jgi:uncharacterized protein (TIGR00369 family)
VTLPREPRLLPSPINDFLGIELCSLSTTEAEARLALRPEFLQEYGVVQGGILTALADATAVFLLLYGEPSTRAMTSIELKQNFLRAGRPGRGDLVARATLVRRGRTVAVARSSVHQGDDELTTGLFTYLFLDAPEASDRGPGAP